MVKKGFGIRELRGYIGDEMADVLETIRRRRKRFRRLAITFLALSCLLFLFWALGFGVRLYVDSKTSRQRSTSAEFFFFNQSTDQRGGLEVVWVYGTGTPRMSRVRGFLISWTLGFVGGVRYPDDAGVPVMTITDVSYWPFITIFFSIALLSFRHYQRITQSIGRCEICGYDLRAHQPGQRCPECGTEIPGDPKND